MLLFVSVFVSLRCTGVVDHIVFNFVTRAMVHCLNTQVCQCISIRISLHVSNYRNTLTCTEGVSNYRNILICNLRRWYSNYGYTITHITLMNGGPVIHCMHPCHNKELKDFVCSMHQSI